MGIFSKEELDAFKTMQFQSPSGMPGVQGAAKPAAPQKKKKNFWLDQISTVGGIVGGIGGGIAGAVGGAGIGAVPGAALGGAAGSGLGETLENILSPDTGDWGNVAEETILGGVFAGGPLKLAKVGYGAARGGIRAGTSQIATEGIEQALKMSTRGKIKTQGDKLLASQYGTIGRPTIKAARPGVTVPQLADYGITKPQDAERIAGAITGTNGILNKQVTAAIGDAGIVPTRTLPKVLKQAITDNGLVDSQAKSVTQTVTAQLKTLQKTGSRPKDVLRVMKNLEKRAANLQGKGGNYGMPTPERVDQAKALLQVRNELQEQLYNTAGANKNLPKVLTPELRQQLINLQPGSNEWVKFVDSKVMSATDISQLRNAQAPFVNIQKIIDDGADNAFSMGGRVGNSLSNTTIPGLALSGAQKLGTRPIGQALRKIGGSQGNASGMAMNAGRPSPTGIAARVGIGSQLTDGLVDGIPQQPQGLEDVLGGQASGEIYPNQTPWLENGTSGPLDPNTMQPMGGQMSPYSRENLLMDIQRDPQNAKDYIAYYTQLAEIFEPASAMGDLSQSSANALASSDNAINTVDQLEDLFTGAGGGSGRIGGFFKDVAADAGFDEQAKVYNSLANASVTQIAKALAGSGAGTVSDMDAKVIMNALPTIRDTPAEARAKFAALRQRLDAAKNNTMMYGGGASQPQTLQDVYSTQGAY